MTTRNMPATHKASVLSAISDPRSVATVAEYAEPLLKCLDGMSADRIQSIACMITCLFRRLTPRERSELLFFLEREQRRLSN